MSPRSRTRRRSIALIAGALVVVVALIGGFLIVLGSSPEGARALALSFERGQTQRYRIEYTADLEASTAGGPSVPVAGTMTQTLTWRVLSVDEKGVATIEVTIADVEGSIGGQQTTAPFDLRTTMRIDPGGRILLDGRAGVTAFGPQQNLGPAGGFPGTGQITSILPPRVVEPGDTWTDSFEQVNPLGKGSIETTSTSEYLRDEEVDGASAAVVRSRISIPIDLSIDYVDLIGGLSDAGGSAIDRGLSKKIEEMFADLSFDYEGSIEAMITTWVGIEDQRMLRADVDYSIDVAMRMRGLPARMGALDPAAPVPTDMNLRGTLRLSVDAL